MVFYAVLAVFQPYNGVTAKIDWVSDYTFLRQTRGTEVPNNNGMVSHVVDTYLMLGFVHTKKRKKKKK